MGDEESPNKSIEFTHTYTQKKYPTITEREMMPIGKNHQNTIVTKISRQLGRRPVDPFI